MYNCDVTLRLKELSPTTEEDVDLDLLDQQLFWLGLGNIFITSKVSPEQATKRHPGEKFSCEVCGNGVDSICLHENVVIKSEAEIQQPEENRCPKSKKYFACQECGEHFKTRENVENHMKTTCKQRFKCDKCEKYFKDKVALNHHLVDHTVQTLAFICKECGNTSKSKINFHKHMKTHRNLSRCDICDEYFTHRSLKIHRLSDHKDEFKYTCDQCPAKFKAPRSLKIHQATHSDQDKPDDHKYSKQKYSCQKCQKKFVWLRWLKYHEIGCVGGQNEKPFHCKKCGKSFKTKQILGRHDKFVHTNYRPFACKECDKKFQTKMILRTHMRVHTGEKPFKCKTCGMTFAYHHGLKNHENQGICNYIVDDSND